MDLMWSGMWSGDLTPQVCGLRTWECEEIVLWRSFSNLPRSHGIGGKAGMQIQVVLATGAQASFLGSRICWSEGHGERA